MNAFFHPARIGPNPVPFFSSSLLSRPVRNRHHLFDAPGALFVMRILVTAVRLRPGRPEARPCCGVDDGGQGWRAVMA